MKTVSNNSRVASVSLVLVATLGGLPAWADIVCHGPAGTPLIHAFELGAEPEAPWGSEKEAALLFNKGGGNTLLTGHVSSRPTRVATLVDYHVADKAGGEGHLTYSLGSLDSSPESFLGCGRAGCVDLVVTPSNPTFTYGGETYALSCQETDP